MQLPAQASANQSRTRTLFEALSDCDPGVMPNQGRYALNVAVFSCVVCGCVKHIHDLVMRAPCQEELQSW